MALRGTVKRHSVEHEDHIARLYDGKRSASSGASATDPGDVSAKFLLIECKMSTPEAKTPIISKKIQEQFEKIAQEAWEHDKEPMMALRYYAPSSPLATSDGYVDLVMRLASDDAVREADHVASVQ